MLIWMDSHPADGLLDGLEIEDLGRRVGVEGGPDQMVRFALDLDERATQLIWSAGTDPGVNLRDACRLQRVALEIRERLLA